MPRATAPAVTPVVFIVDDDISVRESLQSLIADAGWRPEVYASAEEFLNTPHQVLPSCLLLDLSLPDLNGLEVQRRMACRPDLPIIFITGHADVRATVQAMKAGAVEFLTKPFVADELLNMIRDALARSQFLLKEAAENHALRARFESLTQRERQVMSLVVRGCLNKQVGGELEISEITVKAHRGRVMRKMQASSFAELVRIAARLGLSTAGKD